MQKLILLTAFLYISTFLGGPALGAPSSATIQRADLVASGLTCSMCSNSIYKALIALPFVAKVNTDLEHSSFGIFFRSGETPNLDAIRKAVTGAGFSVDTLTLTLSLDHVPVRNDTHLLLAGLNFHFLGVPDETLNGTTTLRLVDKDFLPLKTYRKYAALTSMACVKTGVMEPCCTKSGAPSTSATRMYHVTI